MSSTNPKAVEMHIADIFGVIIFATITILTTYLTYTTIKKLFRKPKKTITGTSTSNVNVSCSPTPTVNTSDNSSVKISTGTNNQRILNIKVVPKLPTQIMCTITLVSLTLCSFSLLIGFLKICITGFNDGDGIASYCSFVAYLFYFVAQFGILWMLIFRIEFSFKKNSFLSYSTKTIKTLKICSYLVMILPIFIIFGIVVEIEILLYFVGPIWFLLYMGLFITLFGMFVSRINKVTKMEQKHAETDERSAEKSLFLELSIKCTLLSGITVFSTFGTYFIGIVLSVIITLENAISVWPLIVISLDCFVNAVCVCLFYAFNNDMYYKVCKCGHSCIKQCKMKRLNRKVQTQLAAQDVGNQV